jgi:hypothetical protein
MVVGCCEHRNELQGSMQGDEFLYCLSDSASQGPVNLERKAHLEKEYVILIFYFLTL